MTVWCDSRLTPCFNSHHRCTPRHLQLRRQQGARALFREGLCRGRQALRCSQRDRCLGMRRQLQEYWQAGQESHALPRAGHLQQE